MLHTLRQVENCLLAILICVLLSGCSTDSSTQETAAVNPPQSESDDTIPHGSEEPATPIATFGSGCFWCTEAVFDGVEGVLETISGYSGGSVENPSYEEVCAKTTGHAEVVQIRYDPSKVSFKELLEIFWKTHDPTTPNQQGNDVGPQYRSVIFYHDEKQRELAEQYKQRLNEAKAFAAPVVTEISPLKNFYAAEDYHQDYYSKNPYQGYCQFVVRPKVEKFREAFQDKLKKSE